MNRPATTALLTLLITTVATVACAQLSNQETIPSGEPEAVEIPKISIEDFRAELSTGNAVALDVRGTVPYKLGHIPGAISMPLGLIGDRVEELPKDKLLVPYCSCSHEQLSNEAFKRLHELGITRVAVLVGGYNQWVAAGLQIDTLEDPEDESSPAPTPEPVAAGRGRMRPPSAVTCDRNQLTSWTGIVTGYKRQKGSTWIQLHTDSDTDESTTIQHPGTDDPSGKFLLFNAPFKKEDWKKIESKRGVLIDGMRATVWVCEDGETGPVVDWRPGEPKVDAP